MHGLELAAAAVVAAAVIAMARTLARGPARLLIAVGRRRGRAARARARRARSLTILVAGAIGAVAFRGSRARAAR